jgi:thioredoxin-dependent peroxiredoxin
MKLKVGDSIPHFKAKDSNGNDFNSNNYIGKQPLVIYFYPKDNTPGCTTQACSFRDNYQEFKDFGAEVIGISSDSVKSHIQFKSRFNLPFILLSDNDKKLRKLFGVENNFMILPGRETFVCDKNGIIIMIFNSMSANNHINKALEILRNSSLNNLSNH